MKRNPRISVLGTSSLGFARLLAAGLSLFAGLAPGQDVIWSTGVGGAGTDSVGGIAVDSSGNVFTTGYFQGVADFDPGPGVSNLTSLSITDSNGFISKQDGAGNLIWARPFTGGQAIAGTAIVVDSVGNIYVTGYFYGVADFDPGPGVVNLSSAVTPSAFVAKLNSAGNLVWARQLGESGSARASGIAVDAQGNVYTTGSFYRSGDFDPGPGAFTLTGGSSSTFISKLDNAGNFVWARRISGSLLGGSSGIAVDAAGVYVVGSHSLTTDFDPGPGSFTLTTSSYLTNAFILKLDSAGNFVWARQVAGEGSNSARSVAAAAGKVYAAGYFTLDADFGGGVSFPAGGSQGAFVAAFDSAGNLVWARAIGGPSYASADAVAIDAGGNVYAAGNFSDFGEPADLDPGPGVLTLPTVGTSDVYLMKLDADGNLVWARRSGGVGTEFNAGIAVQGDAVYAVGLFDSTIDFHPDSDAFNLTSAGETDILVARHENQSDPGGRPSISSDGIVLATLLPTVGEISPLSIISVFGSGFSDNVILYPNLNDQGAVETILGGTCLLMNGAALPILAVTPTQINAQASASRTLGPASFSVVADCATPSAIHSAPVRVGTTEARPIPRALSSHIETAVVEEATPAFFLYPPLAENGFIAARFNEDHVVVGPEGMFIDQFGPSRPALPGEVIVLYGTGWGATTAQLEAGQLSDAAAGLLPSAAPSATFGGLPLAPEDILYVGATPEAVGLYQIAIRVPFTASPGDNQVVLTVYGKLTPSGPVIPVGTP